MRIKVVSLLLPFLPLLNWTAHAQSTTPQPPRPTAYDFDGNGKSDLVWRNMNTGEVAIWVLNRSFEPQRTFKFDSVDLQWQIAGAGDLDGDGKADLIWRNTQSGDIAEWLMDGTTVKSWATISSVPAEDILWQIVAVNDLDGDGKVDLMWRNTQTGRMWESLLDGASVKEQGAFNGDPAWDKSFSPIQVSHLEVSQFVVTSYLWRGRYNYYPRLRLAETGGKTGISVTNLLFRLNGIGAQGNGSPWNPGKRIDAGTSREMNVLGAYGDPELEISSSFNVASVSVTISFTDDLGASGSVTVPTDVSPADAGAWQIQ